MAPASTNANALISIVNDDESVREALEGLIESLGFRVRAFQSALDFLASPDIADTSCMIADVHMPQMSGLELCRRLTDMGRGIPTILITAYPDDAVRDRALADGVVGYLIKPFDDDALVACVHSALRSPDLDVGA
jgi:FixJ family two-component response regulator